MEMEFKGLKGRWVIDNEEFHINEYGTEVFVISNENITEVEIANVYGNKANALLISKAPEMLEFLMELYNDKETHSGMFPSQQKKLEKLIREATEL